MGRTSTLKLIRWGPQLEFELLDIQESWWRSRTVPGWPLMAQAIVWKSFTQWKYINTKARLVAQAKQGSRGEGLPTYSLTSLFYKTSIESKVAVKSKVPPKSSLYSAIKYCLQARPTSIQKVNKQGEKIKNAFPVFRPCAHRPHRLLCICHHSRHQPPWHIDHRDLIQWTTTQVHTSYSSQSSQSLVV